jgi:predicted permease
MRLLSRLRSRFDALVHGDRREREMDDELRFHVEMEAQKHLAQGVPAAEARRLALLSLGGVEKIKEECRDSWGVRALDNFSRDVRYGLRSLRAAPGFTAAVIVTLALGIGANSAIFSVVSAVLLRPLPYGRGEQLAAVRASAPEAGFASLPLSPLEVRDLREQSQTLAGLVEYHSMSFTLLGGAEPQRVQTGVVSWNYFDVLEVKPVLGRAFRSADEGQGADAVLLLGNEFWRDQLGGDPEIVGRRFEMNDRVHTVIGVLPPLPRYPDDNDVFMPTSACPFRSRASVAENREARMLSAFARVKDGVPLEQARADLQTLANRLLAQYPDAYPKQGGLRVDAVALRDEMVRSARPTFLVLLATVALVLLIACFNVASLIIARLAAREKELALRAALGAGRGRLIGQLLTEATLLSLAGGLLGLLLASMTLGLLTSFAARFTARAGEIRMDASVLAFTLFVSIATGLLAGALPGLPPWERLAQALQEGARSTLSRGRSRLRGALVAGELALSFVLLVGAALMLRSFVKLLEVDPGFRAERVLTAQVDLNWSHYFTPERKLDNKLVVDSFHEPVLEKLRALPGVVKVAMGGSVPLNAGFQSVGTLLVEARGTAGEPQPHADFYVASPEYFEAIGVPVLRGRSFTASDRSAEAGVAVVSQSLARSQWGAAVDPVGQRISLDDGKTWRTVVGVAGDVRNFSLERPPSDTVYVPFLEFPGVGFSYFIRTLGDPTAIGRQLRESVYAVAPQTAVTNLRTLEQVRTDSLASPRLTATLLGLFAFVAVAIAATGLSGLIAFSVSQRTHEIGIRMALGADARQVLRLLLRQGLEPVVLGLALGVAAALALARLVSGLLFGVAPTDIACFVGCAVLLMVVGVLACLPAARRATSIHPQAALRSL